MCSSNAFVCQEGYHVEGRFDLFHSFLKILKPDISKNLIFFAHEGAPTGMRGLSV